MNSNNSSSLPPDCGDIFDRLFAIIDSRKTASSEKSYVAKLFAGGTQAISAKVIEEAGEFVSAAERLDRDHITHECCDLLFHSFVLASYKGLSLNDLRCELARRFGVSGLDEKAARDSGE